MLYAGSTQEGRWRLHCGDAPARISPSAGARLLTQSLRLSDLRPALSVKLPLPEATPRRSEMLPKGTGIAAVATVGTPVRGMLAPLLSSAAAFAVAKPPSADRWLRIDTLGCAEPVFTRKHDS